MCRPYIDTNNSLVYIGSTHHDMQFDVNIRLYEY